MPSRRRGETPEPRLPHERDESADQQGASAGEIGRQAKDDLDRGLTDTDRGPVLERTYDRLKRRDR